ncbi:Proteinase inhibitor [Thalictrum thalictroides]|uniref:Proteinase inhibitor n=1 Tax=Thalictrum thalictroides TaxID=46969 RepID=A0A7J6W804_THATH|nr:Proteinase inhibitor [Thalictrum thalictroides]
MAEFCQGKREWPELIGYDGEVAARRIEKENPLVNAIVLLEGTPVTKDFRCDRVWVWINKQGKVVRTPRIT